LSSSSICARCSARSAPLRSLTSPSSGCAAETVAVARTWASLIAKAARVFPVAPAVLLGSGAYLVQHGWIVAGLAGVAVLFAVGAGVVGGRSRALARELHASADGPLGERAARVIRRHPGAVASWMSTGLS
jgi:hypothetical protein